MKFVGMKKFGAFISQTIISNHILAPGFPQSHHTFKICVAQRIAINCWVFPIKNPCIFMKKVSLVFFLEKERTPEHKSINSFLTSSHLHPS